jgi:ATP-dependent helicase/nuclease subunit A
MFDNSPARQQQRKAASPHQSVWVSANAGTGKTRVLVDRLLRLLLQGVPPHSILCVTFTKAAAAEIDDRVRQIMARWVTLSDDKLIEQLTDITGASPDGDLIKTARTLFSRMINAERGLSIQTIHSFCQSVLARFPLEAGILPGFAIASDDQSVALQEEAFERTLRDSAHNSVLHDACLALFDRTDQAQILSLLCNLQHQQDKWLHHDHTQIQDKMRHVLDIPTGVTHQSVLSTFYAQTSLENLRSIIADLSSVKGQTAPKLIDALSAFITEQPFARGYEAYTDTVLTANGTINKNIHGLLNKIAPHHADLLSHEFERILRAQYLIKATDIFERNDALLIVASYFCARYQELKQHHALLDYHDQIRLTAQLLTEHHSPESSWVMYKLDGGIRHLLVDEAQDTSPAQWHIILAIVHEMAYGEGIHKRGERSIFIVGDEKQSIYSFQDADITSYQHNRHALETLFKNHGLPWDDVPLITNFRSSSAILDSVDGVFTPDHLRHSITQDDHVKHDAFYATRAGLIEAWPLFVTDKSEQDGDYMPVSVIQERKATEYLCQSLADKIHHWIHTGQRIERLDRAIEPSDILILLQKRAILLHPLIKALKDRNIPVSGVDRLVLTEQLIVKDIMALLQIILYPQDDLTLASLLKSPFFTFNEQDLFALAHQRGIESLWQRLQQNERYHAITDFIRNLITHHHQGAGPYHLLSLIVNRPCPANDKSGRHALITRLGFDAEDALNELLNMALQFEQDHRPDIQLFLAWLQKNDAEIKRDTQNTQQNHVRIMTVHGSKGLQAPLVILADASVKPSAFKSGRDILWQDDIPFWVSSKNLPETLDQSLQIQNKALLDEYYRLLYVAMTRAEDALYVTGWKKDKEDQKNIADWHQIIMSYLCEHGEALDPQNPDTSAYILKKDGQNTKEKKQDNTPSLSPITTRDIPWLYSKPPLIAHDKPRPLRPSRPPVAAEHAIGPLQQPHTARFARGLIVHKILQHLTHYPADQQEQALGHMLAYREFDLPAVEQQKLHHDILSILQHPDCAFIWSQRGHNEVSVTGEIQYRGQDFAVVGVIDRLIFHNGSWWIIDYKTNRTPASTWDQVPDSYIFQIASYRALIQKLYPDHPVHGVLVWTSQGGLMRLPDERLDQMIAS